MILSWFRFAVAAGFLLLGLLFMIAAAFGVNRFRRALNRMHAAALGDTLGILFVLAGLMVIRGFSMDTLKLFLVIAFFWVASPVSGHMISRLEAMTDEDLGELTVIQKGTGQMGPEMGPETGPEREEPGAEKVKALVSERKGGTEDEGI